MKRKSRNIVLHTWQPTLEHSCKGEELQACSTETQKPRKNSEFAGAMKTLSKSGKEGF
jgi:hypothetical protein